MVMVPCHLQAREGDVVDGPLQPGQVVPRGAIKYPECRKPVYAPSDWDHALAERSARKPDVRLELEFVHGYEGKTNTCPNLFFARTGEVVYYVGERLSLETCLVAPHAPRGWMPACQP